MSKYSRITTLIAVVLLVLGGCAAPAAKAGLSPAQTPAAATPQVNAPATIPVPASAAVPSVNAPPAPAVPELGQTAMVGAAFTTSNLKVTPSKVIPGSTVTITATVKNTGTAAGAFSVVMNMKGDDEACPMISPVAKEVTLAAGAVQDIKFDVLMAAGLAGGYTVTVGSQSAALVVQ